MSKTTIHRTNLVIAAIVHIVIIGGLVFFASKEGMLGEKMKTLSVALVPKAKIEEPKPKAAEPKVVPIPVPTPEVKQVPQMARTEPQSAPSVVAPPVAPPQVEIPSINFSDGAKDVISTTDPILLYKSSIEVYIRSRWQAPEKPFETMVELNINEKGDVLAYSLMSNTGDDGWTETVKNTLGSLKSFPKPPPRGFPKKFQVRFDTADTL